MRTTAPIAHVDLYNSRPDLYEIHILTCFLPSRFLTWFDPILGTRRSLAAHVRAGVMFYDPKREERLEGLLEQLRLAPAATSDLFSNIVADACPRLSRTEQSAKAAHIRWLSEAGAWTDAAPRPLELALPEWTVRRLIRDDSAWICSLPGPCDCPT